jgi:FKBP-type peptidyl-prolyl cis-trans isomerase FklB
MKRLPWLFVSALLGASSMTHAADPAQTTAPATPAADAPARKPNSLLEHMETLADETNRISYSIGVNVARNLQANFPSVNVDFFILGFQDVLIRTNEHLKLSENYINQSIARYNELSTAHVRQKVQDFKAENLKHAEEFLEINGKKEGVVTLPSGLQYHVISPGKGPTPKPDGVAIVQYHGHTLAGNTVDSTLIGDNRGPKQMVIKEALPFWQEVLPKMPLGAKWELYVPPKLAYGDKGSDRVPPNELLVYSVEVVGLQ